MLERLYRELQRLFSFADLTGAAATQSTEGRVSMLSSAGLLRTLVIHVHRASDWPTVANFLEAVQIEDELPVPVVAVTSASYQIWFSLERPVTLLDGQRIVQRLGRHLADLPAGRVSLFPETSETVPLLQLVPAFDKVRQRWSAFIDPGMGTMFMDDPGLDIEPNPERQADLLSAVKSISGEDIRRLLDAGHADATIHELPMGVFSPSSSVQALGAYPETDFTDPRDFLRAVMNSPLVGIGDRISAAKALLPDSLGGESCLRSAALGH